MINTPGVNEFIDLADTPNSYAGQAAKATTVNGSETALEFTNPVAGSGTVTDFIFTNANGITGVVTLSTTTPTLVLSLGAITPTSVAASGTVTGSNLSGTNTGDNAVNSLYSGLATSKQDTLVSGTNIKTINGNSVLGSGDLSISGGSGLTALQVFSAVSIRM